MIDSKVGILGLDGKVDDPPVVTLANHPLDSYAPADPATETYCFDVDDVMAKDGGRCE